MRTVKCFSREAHIVHPTEARYETCSLRANLALQDKHVALVSLAAKDAMKALDASMIGGLQSMALVQEASPNGGPLLSRLRGVRHGPDLSVFEPQRHHISIREYWRAMARKARQV